MDKRVLLAFFVFIIVSGLIWVFTLMLKVETEEMSSSPRLEQRQPPSSARSFSEDAAEQEGSRRVTGPLLN